MNADILEIAFQWAEWLAVALGLLSVLGNIKLQRWGWIAQIGSSLLYCAVFARQSIYGLAGLQLYFIVTAAMAYWKWHPAAQSNVTEVRSLNRKQTFLVYAIGFVATIALTFLLNHLSESSVAIGDALTTVGSVIAQWLMSHYYLQTWYLWAAVNAISIGLFAYIGLWPTALLYGIFFAMAITGYLQWRKAVLR